ncbi:holin [Streptomyces sp. IB2014 016-6]|uniref:holin n=1 Tax=Streptomyces sp. IB2014 016-6 TaxID=2517818 RepID=UPI0011C76EB8|nr:holin [Streptomyces sp. IB2014 016-6]TXL91572.1 holin [Streptomyces sp. IB2014 016-6]
MAASDPIETKVKASSVLTYLASLAGLAILGAVTDDPSLISGMPDALEPFVLALVPAAAAAVAGWAAPHTPRPGA